MHSSLLVLLALLGGAHAFASTPKEVAGTTGKGVPSRMTYSGTTSSVCEADSCKYAGDGDCDDGGEGSAWSVCELGSDGSDCADRGTKGCTVPQCAVGEYHKANAQGGYDCGLASDVWVEGCAAGWSCWLDVEPCAVGEYRKSEGAKCTVVETSECVLPAAAAHEPCGGHLEGMEMGISAFDDDLCCPEEHVCDGHAGLRRCMPTADDWERDQWGGRYPWSLWVKDKVIGEIGRGAADPCPNHKRVRHVAGTYYLCYN